MKFSKIVKLISNHESIILSPPVLMDIGASGYINKHWKKIASFSICIAFDADDREFEYIEDKKSLYKKLIKVNKILVAEGEGIRDFYLTKSPYCSSLLEPNNASLEKFQFSSLFDIEKQIEISSISLPKVIDDLSIKNIDWFKTDSQGTDLRLLISVDPKIFRKMIVIEIEPGFIDAYKDEDKILDCLNFMEQNKDFFLADFIIKGPLRIPDDIFNSFFKSTLLTKIAAYCNKPVPGWAEITFMNDMENPDAKFTSRDIILAWLFSSLQDHHALAYVYGEIGQKRFKDDPIFITLQNYSTKKLKYGMYSLSSLIKLSKFFFKRFFKIQ